MHKIVNGEIVPLTPQEIEEFNQRELDHQKKLEEYEKVAYKDVRRSEYDKRGCTNDARIDAIWERIIENRPETSDALQLIREQVKREIPKPN